MDRSLRRHDPDQVQRVTTLLTVQWYLSPLAGHPSVVPMLPTSRKVWIGRSQSASSNLQKRGWWDHPGCSMSAVKYMEQGASVRTRWKPG